jgi:two-component system, NarL family, response regulator LiaR
MMAKLKGEYGQLILYGICMALLLFLLKWLELRFVIIDHALEVYVGAIALIFTGLGIWLAMKIVKPKLRVVEKEVYVSKPFSMNQKELELLNLSKRELEVLQLMAEGLSNKEIADRLFVSLSTIKTHANNLFDKMNVERRTQAIEKGKRLGIIP